MSDAHRELVKDLLTQAAALPAGARAAFIAERAADAGVAREALDLLPTLEDSAFMAAPTVGLPCNPCDGSARTLAHEAAGDTIDRYKLLQKIGEGGFGVVFLAEQIAPVVRRVALKIIKLGMDARQVIARFEAERQALAMMDHPNIARVLDAGATRQGRPFFVMELVRGEPITQYCDREALTVPQRLALFRQVCCAVQHAHQKGIIHRDLKPTNVLVTVVEGEPVPKVIDFGIAKATAGRLTDKTLFTEFHQLIGTPEYMSPEQAELSGADVDTRSDIYALGVLLYNLLVGSSPIETQRLKSAPLAEIQRLIQLEDPPRPSLRLAGLAASASSARFGAPAAGPEGQGSSAFEIAWRRQVQPVVLRRVLRGDLDWIVMKCLEKDRRRRYQTVSALADDIGRYLGHQPVLATPPSAAYQFRKFVRRHRTGVVAGGAVALAFLLGTIGTAIGLVWALHAQRQAEQQRTIAKREADAARAINEFMRDILTTAEPEKQGVDIRLVDVLHEASRTASLRFAGQPLSEAQVRDLLGGSYFKLAMWSEAGREYQRALALWREHAGADDPRTLDTETMAAGLAINTVQFPEAERILAGLLPRCARVFGSDHRKTLKVRRSIAITLIYRGRLDEAEVMLRELRAHPNLAEDDELQISIVQTLIMLDRRRAPLADEAQRQVLLDEAESLAREWIQRSERRFGAEAAVTFHGQSILTQVLCDRGRYAAALALGEPLLEKPIARLGDCHPALSDAIISVAKALAHQGEIERGADMYMRALNCVRQKLAPDHPTTLSFMYDSLTYLERAGRGAEGEALARELTETLRALGGGHDAMVIGSETFMAHFISLQGRFDEADEHFQSLRDRADQAGRYDRARLHLYYGSHLVREGQYALAEEQLDRCVSILDDIRSGTSAVFSDDVIRRYLALYSAWDRPDKVAQYERLREEVDLNRAAEDAP